MIHRSGPGLPMESMRPIPPRSDVVDYLDDCYSRYASADPELLLALGRHDRAVSAQVERLLRHTAFGVLRSNEASLVNVLARMPQMHDRLRATWSREDPAATQRLFAHVEQARRRQARPTGPLPHAPNPLRDRELASVA